MAQPRIAVVDMDNRFLRWEDRREVHRLRLFHRSIHVLVFDTRGRMLIQRRSREKLTFPSTWDCACSGHVEEPDYPAGPDERLDEVYAHCAARELKEELGISARLEDLGRFAPDGDHYEQIALYRATHDGPYVLQVEEVDEVRAVTAEELRAMKEPVTPTLRMFAGMAVRLGLF